MRKEYEYKVKCKSCDDIVVVTNENSASLPECNCGKIMVDATPFYCRVIAKPNSPYESLDK